jgi:S-(hydroxymethyl)glutathione dehydrogenase/alcohol dehydrogenase
MKAAVLTEPNAPLHLEDLALPSPRANEVRIRVKACGVCHTDLHVMKGEVRFPVPAVMGHEVSGVIDALGPGVKGFELGQSVIGTFLMPCGTCAWCAKGRDDLCTTFFSLNRLQGRLFDGETRLRRHDGTPLAMYSMAGLAEHAVIPATAVFPAPANVPLEDACLLGCAMMTAYGAVKHQGQVEPGHAVAIVGVGGVGSSAIQLCRAFGATQVIAVDIREDKLAAARALGATSTVDASKEEVPARIAELTNGAGVDVAIEALGLPVTVRQAFQSVRDGGRAVVIGIGAGQAAAEIEITRLVRRGITLAGSYGCRVRSDLPALIRLAESGRIDVGALISERFSLDEAPTAYDRLAKGLIVGRAIVRA